MNKKNEYQDEGLFCDIVEPPFRKRQLLQCLSAFSIEETCREYNL